MPVPQSDLKHRLAAILAADAVGYSRLMAGDDRATVTALDAARAVFRRQIESRQGRVIDMAGDSVLAVFETATGAVTCGLTAQDEINSLCEAVPEDRRMRFRVGVHLGDVIEKADGTVYGDGVNIAARLQSLAEAGGITISDSVRMAVKGKVSAAFEDQGEQSVKNIPDPVHAYRVCSPSEAARPSLAVGGIDLSLPDKPSIAVLPFTNMSGDPEQEYFTDGITEDIITELSRFHSLFVIARNSSFSYKGKSPDIRQVGKELGVRYVLEGSIRKAANRIRVTGQLIDALTGNHIWAEKYDRVLEDVFAVQEELTQAIVAAIAPRIDKSEMERARMARPGNLSAYEIALRASAAARIGLDESDRSSRDDALRLAREALAIDPRCTVALQTIAFVQWQHVYFNTARSISDAIRDGVLAAGRAIAIDNSDHFPYLYRGFLEFLSDQSDVGLKDIRRAHELNPNDAGTMTILAFCEANTADPGKGIEYATSALRLSPRDPSICLTFNVLGWAHFAARDYASAIESAQRSVAEAPKMAAPRLCLAVSWVGSKNIEQARTEFQAWQPLVPELAEARISGHWPTLHNQNLSNRCTTFLRIAAGLEDPSAADALR